MERSEDSRAFEAADVKFSGGLLGRLEKGGEFNVEQTELSAKPWELTVMEVDVRCQPLPAVEGGSYVYRGST